MELDLILEPNLNPDTICELGLLAESYGFRGVWTQNYSSARDAFMSLVPLAIASKRILLGAVIVCPYEMHPMKIVNATLSLNEYSKGRAMVVIGAGGEWPEVMGCSVFDSSYRERRDNVKEALEIAQLAIRKKSINYTGDHYRALRFSTEWHSEPPPTIYHGACGPSMLNLSPYYADGAMMSDVMPAMLAKRLPALEKGLTARSSKRQFKLSNFVAWHVRADKQRSFAEARRELIIRGWLERDWLEPFLDPAEVKTVLGNRWPFLKAWIEKHGNIEDTSPAICEKLVEGLSLAGDYGDIERHIERLKLFQSAGFTEIALRIHEEPEESIRLIGERVLPELSTRSH